MQAEQPKPEGGEKERNDIRLENDRRESGPPPESEVLTLSDRLRQFERWGLLPPRMTEEMLSTTGKEAPPEYREIISRYYKRMSEYYERARGR